MNKNLVKNNKNKTGFSDKALITHSIIDDDDEF